MATPIALFFLLTVASMLSNFSDSMVNANSEGDALIAFKQSLSDPTNALKSWDQNLVDPCTWVYVTCNAANQVTRLYIFPSLSLCNFFFVSLILEAYLTGFEIGNILWSEILVLFITGADAYAIKQ